MKFIPDFRTSGLLFSLILLIFTSCSPIVWKQVADSGSIEKRVMADISYLADDKLKGRGFGTKGEMKAGDYIAKRFKLLGLQPKGENATYFQTFTVKNPSPHGVEFATEKERGSKSGRNVIAYMDHKAPYTIVIGGHYDHLGMGESGSLHMGAPAIHNGADDNASGIALMLELADQLSDVRSFNYLFIAFTGEEHGLWGSNYYCDHETINLEDVSAMINFDMVGRLDPISRKIAVNGTGTSPAWPALINKANVHNLDITFGESGIGPSDHTSFYLEDIPVLHYFTGAHEDYHKPTDDAHLINPDGIRQISDMVMALIKDMDGHHKMTFSKTKDPDPSSTPKMEVTLGVLPDYLYDGKGMRIDGVREGKPAAVAGLAKGDVIIGMGGKDIKDIYAYMEVLGSLHKGDKTTVVVLRDEKEMTFDVQF